MLDFEYFYRVKCYLHILSFLFGLAMLVACSKPAEVPEPVEGPTQELAAIDTLLWHHPDSALAVMMEFAASPEADSMDVFEGHYCQVLVAELLFKNDYGQSNREEVLKAVHYFDSIVGMDGTDTRGASVQGRDAFLAARAQYINGAGYYERDSLIEACGEYLNALRMMGGHFEEKVLVGHKARFMALTYNRLVELFSAQYMQEPAIYCGKQSLAYNRMAKSSPRSLASTLRTIGRQYDKLDLYDSASFYYNAALKYLPDRNDILYRDVASLMAFSEYNAHHNVTISLDSLKSMAAQSADEAERLARYSTIGYIYYNIRQFDSAKVYLIPVFDKDPDRASMVARPLREIALIEGDTVKANQYALILAEEGATAANSQARASQLNELFQQHLQWEQEKAEAESQQAARLRRNRMIVVVCALVVVAGLLAWLLHRRKMRQQRDAASQQMEAEREAHRLEKASMSGRLKRSNQELRELKDQMRQQAGNGAPKQEAQAVSFNDEPICRLIMERVNEGQFKAQMDCKLYQDYALGKEQVMALREAADRHFNQFTVRLAKAYPNLTKGDLDYCCLYLLGLSDADISALMQRAYNTVSERSRKLKGVFGSEESLSVTLRGFASESASN